MEYREIAPGVEIPVLGFGTWGIGGREQPDYRRDEEEIMAIRLAIELGLTHIDTAEFYGAGHSEELVGQAVEGYERNKIFITTKVWHTHLRKDDVIKSINASLDRLRLDFVDLYLIHWPNLAIPLSETMAAMEECVSKGLTRFIGVSNFSAQLMLEAQKKLKNNKIITNQVEYSLLDQKPSMELLPTCRETGISLVAYRPIGRGNLAKPGNKILDELAESYGKSRVQIALNWLIRQHGVFAIPKSSNPVHILDFMGAVGWRLSDDDAHRLSNSFV